MGYSCSVQLLFMVFCVVYADSTETSYPNCTDAQAWQCHFGNCEILNIETNEFKCNCDEGYYNRYCDSTVDLGGAVYISPLDSRKQLQIISNVVGWSVCGCVLALFILTTACVAKRCKRIQDDDTIDETQTPMLVTMISVNSKSSEAKSPILQSVTVTNEMST